MEPLVDTTPVATPTPGDDAELAALAGPAKAVDVDASLTDEQRSKIAEMKSAVADVEVRIMPCKPAPLISTIFSDILLC